MKKLVLLLLLSSCVPLVAEASTMTKRTPPPPRKVRDRFEPNPIAGPGLPMIASTWHGDQYTLPYNDGTKSWRDLLGLSYNLQSVQAAMQKMQERGYIRRADRDTSFAELGVTTCVISYEIPGVPIEERAPAVIATTRAVQTADFGWAPISVVGGIVAVGDSTDLDISDLPGEEAFTVMWTDPNGQARAPGDPQTEQWWLLPNVCSGTWTGGMPALAEAYVKLSAAEQRWWKEFANEAAFGAAVGAAVGAIGAIKLGVKGSAVLLGFFTGAASGGIIAGANYVHNNPYPKPGP